jgi:hypothetical protein
MALLGQALLFGQRFQVIRRLYFLRQMGLLDRFFRQTVRVTPAGLQAVAEAAL